MKRNKLSYLLVFIMSIFLFSCEIEEEDFGTDTNDNSTSATWANNYWKKNSGGTYMDLTSQTPKFCSNGNPVPGTYSALRWEGSNIAFFTLYNAGDEVIFRIEKNGSSLILAPWDDASQQTHDPSTYGISSTFPCDNDGGSNDDGKIAFYTKQNNGCSAISITVDGSITKSLNYYNPNGITDCTVGAIFDLPAGNHTFTAQCNSTSWNGSFNITSSGCIIYELR